jgi:hypothetical protein
MMAVQSGLQQLFDAAAEDFAVRTQPGTAGQGRFITWLFLNKAIHPEGPGHNSTVLVLVEN